jgi:opacity protein-like surface antigen
LTFRRGKCCYRIKPSREEFAIKTIRALLVVALATEWLLSPSVAAPEPYVAGYVGAAFTEDKDLRTELELNGAPFVNGRARDLSFETSVAFGAKAGYFFERDLLGGNAGVELDVYHFEPDLAAQTVRFTGLLAGFTGDFQTRLQSADIEVTAVTLNLLYRFRLLPGPEHPRGRLQPYVGMGAGAFIARLATQTSPFDTNKDISDTDVRAGVQALGGLRYFVTRNIALFAEYKFVQTETFSFAFKESGSIFGFPATETARDRADITSHLFYGGIGFHW